MLKRIVLVTFLALFSTYSARADIGKQLPQPIDEAGTMFLEGIVQKEVIIRKNGSPYTTYRLVTDTNKIRLANQVKGKKGYSEAGKIDLEKYVGKKVSIEAIYTRSASGSIKVKCMKRINDV